MILLVAGLVLSYVATALVLVFALWKGGRDERAAAAIILAGTVASQFASFMGSRWHGPEYWVMAVDGLAFIGFLLIVRRSERFWPVWAAASQLVATITHLAPMVQYPIAMEVYATTQPFWLFPILAALAVGTWNHWKGGPYASPSPS